MTCSPGHHHGGNLNRLIAAFVVIICFMFVEIIGGLIAGSLALLADATHMLADAFALALAASAHWLSRRPADDRLHFGYQRTQVLAAFANGVLLIALLFWIVIEGVNRLIDPVDVSWRPMLIVAIIGLLANGVAFFLLHGGDRDNVNMRGAMLHVVSDFFGSVAAVAAACIIAVGGSARVDPLLSFLVAGLIAVSAIRLLRETGHILLEGAPKNIDVQKLTSELEASSAAIHNIHNVQIWQLTSDRTCLTLHARVDDEAAAASALEAIKTRLEERYGIDNSTIQIEIGGVCPDCEAALAGQRHHHHADEASITPSGAQAGAMPARAFGVGAAE